MLKLMVMGSDVMISLLKHELKFDSSGEPQFLFPLETLIDLNES